LSITRSRSACAGSALSMSDGGSQPVFNEDESVVVVFNGEIYNFRELQRTLKASGHIFKTESDTEVIVHAYEQWGEDCVDYIEGMFAFALAETSKSTRKGNPRVLLARDRLGIKPLYYALVDGALVFSSEVRSLLASGQVEPRLSQSALRSYLLFGSVVEPMTLVEGVCSVPPGHRIVISAATHHSNIRSRTLLGLRRIRTTGSRDQETRTGKCNRVSTVAAGRIRRFPHGRGRSDRDFPEQRY
jgi:asparagine synthase (glutamine-hydrolysing)